jgi:O-antigen/teichoic acid export membrane protein
MAMKELPDIPTSPPRSHRVIPKLASLFSARWLQDLLHAVLFIYLARVSTTTYGEFMLALGLGAIINKVGDSGLNLPLVGLLSRRDGDPEGGLLQVLLLKTGLLLLAFGGVTVFVAWQQYASPLREVALILSLGVGLEAVASTFFTAMQVQGRQAREGWIRVLAAVVGFGYGLGALLWGAPPVILALFKLLETLTKIIGSAWAAGFRRPAVWPSFSALGTTLRRGLIFAVLEISAVLYNKANVFFLQRYGGSEGVAQYSATWQIVDGASTMTTTLILQSVLFPLFVKFWEADRQEVSRLAQSSARWLIALALVLMISLFAESDRLIPLVFGSRYQEAIWLQHYLVITILFGYLHNLAMFLLISMRLERLLVAVYLGALSFNLAFCALVIPVTPLWGAALAIIFTKGAMAFTTFGFVQARLRILALKDLLQLVGGALLALALYYGGLTVVRRGPALVLGLLPMLALFWYWWKTPPKPPSSSAANL